MAFIIPNAVDTTSGNRFEAIDQSEPDSLDFEILGNNITGVVSGCAVVSNSSTTTVSVTSGEVVIDGVAYSIEVEPSLSLPPAPADNRFDLVVVRVSGTSASLAVIPGVNSSTNPTFPKSSNVVTGTPSSSNVNLSTDCVLAAIYRSGSSTITSSRIIDKRKLISTGVYNQGSGAPTGSLGIGTGSMYFDTDAQSGTNSGVYIRQKSGTWASLAMNVGPHFPIGGIIGWPSRATIPDGCISADGQLLSISGNEALFSVYGTLYGGDGVTTFGVPNLNNGYSLKGTSTLSSIGSTTGSDTVTLASGNLPPHTHSLSAHTHTLVHTHDSTHTHSATSNTTGSHTHSHARPETAQMPRGDGTYGNTGISTSIQPPDQTGSNGSHSHTITVATATATTTSQSGTVTSAPSSDVTGTTGSATSFSNVPKSFYVRWIIRARLGEDSSYVGSSGSMSAYIPTLTNVSDEANLDAYWNELGGFVNFRVEFDFDGVTTSSGDIEISTPTTMADSWDVLSFTGALYDATDGSYKPICGRVNTTTSFKLEDVVNGGAVSSGSPITFDVGDKIVISGQYRSVPA